MHPNVRLVANSSTTSATLAGNTKTVASTGTPERLTATATLVESVAIFPLRSNTGAVYVGSGSANDSQHAEAPVIYTAVAGKKIDLSAIYIDVTVNGEGVRYETVN